MVLYVVQFAQRHARVPMQIRAGPDKLLLIAPTLPAQRAAHMLAQRSPKVDPACSPLSTTFVNMLFDVPPP